MKKVFFSEEELIATGLHAKLRGPGCEDSKGTSYLPDAKGEWQTYTVEFTAPADAVALDFQFRTYKGAVVNWDNFSLVPFTSAGTSSATASVTKAYVSGTNLMVKNTDNGVQVDIYTALGAKVQTSTLQNGCVDISDLSKGMYIVRIGKYSQKILIP